MPFDIVAIETWVRGFGAWGAVAFVLIYALSMMAMIPGAPLDALAGAVYGPVLGSILALAGCNLGAIGAFLIARYAGAAWVHRRAPDKVQGVIKSVEDEGWRFVALVRLVPIFPYTVFNYVLGLTRIPLSHYVLTNLVTMVPSTVAYVWLGYAGRNLIGGGSETHTVELALIAIGALAAIVLLPRMAKRFAGSLRRPSR